MTQSQFFSFLAMTASMHLLSSDIKKEIPPNYIDSSYAVSKGINFSAYADVLYLKAEEEGLTFAGVMNAPVSILSNANNSISPIANTKLYSINGNWEWGYRVGAGWHIPHDRWDLSLEWLHYNSDTQRSLRVNPERQTLLIVNTDAQSGIGNHMSIAQSAKETWHLRYDTVDLTLGKAFWATRRLSLTPHVGVRSAWIDQTIKQSYHTISNPNQPLVATFLENKNTQNFWGVGLRAGLNTRWALRKKLSILGNVNFAPVWSYIHIKNKEPIEGSIFNNPLYDVRDHYQTIKFNTDIELGFQWDLYCATYHVGIRALCEYHLWINQNQINRFNDRTFSDIFQPNAFYKEHGNLSLFGGSAGIVLDF